MFGFTVGLALLDFDLRLLCLFFVVDCVQLGLIVGLLVCYLGFGETLRFDCD